MYRDLGQPHFYFAVETIINKVMKKYIVFIACCVAVICSVGCQKIEDEQPKLDDRLVGTKWQTSDFAHKVIYGGNPFEVYEFISTTEVECYTTSGGNVVRSNGTYSYTLAYPHITINVISTNGTVPTHYTFKDSRTMVRDGVDESTPYAKYIKQ